MAWTNKQDLALRARARDVIPRGMYGHESTILLNLEPHPILVRVLAGH